MSATADDCAPVHDDDAQPSAAVDGGDVLDRVAERNTKRIAHPAEVQQIGISAVKKLLETTSMPISRAAKDVADSLGCGMSTVLRWCKDAGVDRDSTIHSRDREWAARLEVTQQINRELTEFARTNHTRGQH